MNLPAGIKPCFAAKITGLKEQFSKQRTLKNIVSLLINGSLRDLEGKFT